MNATIESLIHEIPKAELHLHIEGTLEPEQMFEFAERNSIKIPYATPELLKKAYQFNNLQEFLDIYYQGANVLLTEQDFYDLTMAYLQKAHHQNIKHTEIFFDPQTHTHRGVPFDVVISGINKALQDAEKTLKISSKLIMCFLRHLDEESAFDTLKQALPYKDSIAAVGLDSSEAGNPPSKFFNVFSEAKRHGFLTVAHAGEEGPAAYIEEAVKHLNVHRIDHGNKILDDTFLTKEIAHRKIPLTLCPLSNLKLCVIDNMENHPVKTMLDAGLMATINSDDPAYFGGYINENYLSVTRALNLSVQDIATLARNSFEASFIDERMKQKYLTQLNEFLNNYPA